LVRDRALAEDLTQETFVRAQRSAEGCRDAARERTWLHSIVLNLVRDHFRALGRHPPPAPESEAFDLPSDAPDAESAVLEAEMSACLDDLVAQLPVPQREAVLLHDQQGLTHEEVASVLGVSVRQLPGARASRACRPTTLDRGQLPGVDRIRPRAMRTSGAAD
jgi:RNA polymerase sigma-70 factor (ECF subfamily)